VADEDEPAAVRKPRADAERNRVRLLETAKSAFAEKGSAASLDEIARIAGVGAGTLYRHFPTRDALVAAVYRNETEQLVAAAARLAEMHPPVMALR
jgi:AcrR family transcriptional regulator